MLAKKILKKGRGDSEKLFGMCDKQGLPKKIKELADQIKTLVLQPGFLHQWWIKLRQLWESYTTESIANSSCGAYVNVERFRKYDRGK